MKNLLANSMLFVAFIVLFGCNETSTDPNKIGGSTDLAITKIGTTRGVYVDSLPPNSPLSNLNGEVKVIKNENGIVTTSVKFTFNREQILAIDTMLGIQNIPVATKYLLIGSYINKFGGTLDTTDKTAMKFSVNLKAKYTSEGIQDYMYSKGDESKPFTIVKYGGSVGDSWSFTTTEGKKITRTIIEKNPIEDYSYYGFFRVKTIKVEEKVDDGLIESFIYVTNHKFGLVGLKLKMKNGKVQNILTPTNANP